MIVPRLVWLALLLAPGRVAWARPEVIAVSDARFGLRFAVPAGWRTQVDSTYQIVSRGREGGLETHVVVFASPRDAVRDYFLTGGEAGPIVASWRWTCAASLAWRLNPRVAVAACAWQLENGHALVVTLTAEKTWLRRAGGDRFLRSLAVRMRGFRADDD
jgi:hypothetical protein